MQKLAEGVKCECHRYHEHWRKRHGCIFVPSWEYDGPFKDVLHSLTSDTVLTDYDPVALSRALNQWWDQYFPSALKGKVQVPTERIWRPWHRAVLTPRSVSKLKKFLSHLVVMGIDKGKTRLLLVCPKLFEKLYRATFPCESDPHHFQEVKLCEVDYVAALKAGLL